MPKLSQPSRTVQDRVTTRGNQSPPLTMGAERLHYQFSNLVPQVHLTFVSIVQGIAFGILLQSLPIPASADSSHLGTYVLAQYGYLAYIISGLLVVLIWKQFVQACLFYLWPLSVLQISLMLLIAVAETVTFREIAHINIWILGLGMVAIIGGLIRFNNLQIRSAIDYDSDIIKSKDDAVEIFTGTLYVILGVVLLTAGLTMQFMHVLAQYSPTVSWLALMLVLCLLIVVLVIDARGVKDLIEDVTEGSDLEYASPGTIKYRSDVLKKPSSNESSELETNA